MGGLKATEVFTPGAFPKHTYVERNEGHEQRLKDAIATPAQVVSLSGPSKSGKTVLVERVVGFDNLIPVGGARIGSAEQLWDLALDWMGTPNETTTTRGSSSGVAAQVGTKAEASAVIVKAEGNASLTGNVGKQDSSTQRASRTGMSQVAREIANSDYVLLVDDFHYMDRDVQVEVAKQIKEAVRIGISIVTAAVPHRADDVLRANPELRGRIMAVDLGYWRQEELVEIAQVGFGKLQATVAVPALKRFAKESAGSPQLMQRICLEACFFLGLREAAEARTCDLDNDAQNTILERAAATTDFRSLVDVLDAGPRTRGMERKVYTFKDGTQGDVYRCVLKAIAAEPLRLSFNYDDFLKRVERVCVGDSPSGASVVSTCAQMSKLADSSFPKERVIDWDATKTVLDIPDPYLMFYLRWSGRLSETETG